MSGGFVQDKTGGEIKIPIPVNVNKLIFNDYDLIVAISATVPHEATGFSGGLKIFFPGISGPEVIDLFHWAAAMISIENLIGTVNNAARDILNEGARYIFRNLKTRVVSFNMVNAELENAVLPLGLYFAAGYEGFIEAYEAACNLSIKAHIKYIDIPLNKVVQVMPENYDEIWTAGKGSYKLQRPGVMAENGEIILYGPHIKVFHSNDSINSDIINTGYHCRDYLKNYLERHPGFCKNSAAHLMNVAGPGKYDPSIDCEKLKFKITLATAITEELCKKVNLNYRNPDTLKKIDFQSSGKLWIEDGGKYLYELNTKKAEV
ncbi:MAG: DUF2088 domain-containing protein [Actinobacteria bacterium]|nr:DUF2088 domain-containing protein [Actinomycetota bacterium]